MGTQLLWSACAAAVVDGEETDDPPLVFSWCSSSSGDLSASRAACVLGLYAGKCAEPKTSNGTDARFGEILVTQK